MNSNNSTCYADKARFIIIYYCYAGIAIPRLHTLNQLTRL